MVEAIAFKLNDLAFIYDMEKGLGEAINIVFSNVQHQICLRHFWKNLKKTFHCSDSHRPRGLGWLAINIYTKHGYNDKLNELFAISPQIHSYLLSLPYK